MDTQVVTQFCTLNILLIVEANFYIKTEYMPNGVTAVIIIHTDNATRILVAL